jgi:hypothetical protein
LQAIRNAVPFYLGNPFFRFWKFCPFCPLDMVSEAFAPDKKFEYSQKTLDGISRLAAKGWRFFVTTSCSG